MKVSYVPTLGLPSGIRVKQYEGDDIKKFAAENPDGFNRLAEIANLYLRQKGPQVWGRGDMVEAIAKLGFKPILEPVVKDGDPTDAWAETEAQYLDRFIAALVSGELTLPSFPLKATEKDAREKEVLAHMQKIADGFGEVDKDNKPLDNPPCYVLDLNRPVRVSKPKTPAKWAVEAATNIINNKNEAKWKTNWSKGYKNGRGIQIDPIADLKPFDVKAPAGAKPEDIEATRQSNIANLAWNLMEDDKQVRAKSNAEYA